MKFLEKIFGSKEKNKTTCTGQEKTAPGQHKIPPSCKNTKQADADSINFKKKESKSENNFSIQYVKGLYGTAPMEDDRICLYQVKTGAGMISAWVKEPYYYLQDGPLDSCRKVPRKELMENAGKYGIGMVFSKAGAVPLSLWVETEESKLARSSKEFQDACYVVGHDGYDPNDPGAEFRHRGFRKDKFGNWVK